MINYLQHKQNLLRFDLDIVDCTMQQLTWREINDMELIKFYQNKINKLSYDKEYYINNLLKCLSKTEITLSNIEEIKNALASIQHSNRSVDPCQKKTVTVDQVRSQLLDFLELSHKLEPMEFRQLLQASIEKIEASKYHLKHVHFSFIVYMPEDPTDPRDPLLHIHDKPSILLRAIYFKHSHHLFMIRFPLNNPKSSINLFQ